MGIIADAVLNGGGRVTGIIPAHLHDAEIAITASASSSSSAACTSASQLMFERSDAFAVLPGGLGTLDELFEILTWKQLRLHDKPIVIADVAGYWRKLLGLVDQIVESGFADARILGPFPDGEPNR